MKLKDWLKKENLVQEKLSEDLGISQVAISYYVNGQKIPRPETMAKIVTYTNGEVTANDFYGIEEKKSE